MKSFLRNVALLSFTGGVAAAVAGAKLLKSDKARQLAVKTLATGKRRMMPWRLWRLSEKMPKIFAMKPKSKKMVSSDGTLSTRA